MYELLEIESNNMTRFIKLKNIDTGMIDECFDDSALVSKDNFDFMRVGQRYDCKIKLFGNSISTNDNKNVICKLIGKEVIIGKEPMVEVEIDGNKYYILKKKVWRYLDSENLIFNFTRKDLIQVNSTIHADYLKPKK